MVLEKSNVEYFRVHVILKLSIAWHCTSHEKIALDFKSHFIQTDMLIVLRKSRTKQWSMKIQWTNWSESCEKKMKSWRNCLSQEDCLLILVVTRKWVSSTCTNAPFIYSASWDLTVNDLINTHPLQIIILILRNKLLFFRWSRKRGNAQKNERGASCTNGV